MNYLIVVALMISSLKIFAQLDNKDIIIGSNELRLNVPATIASFPEITYERILSDESAIGMSLGISVGGEIDFDFIALPFYRLYFGKKRAAGFFVEPNLAIFSEERNDAINGSEMGIGAGLAIGGKLITKNRWVVEITGGAGRNFLNTDYISDVYPRFGISIGKRF